MKASYSRVSTYSECPFKYRLIYLEHLQPKDNLDPANPLFIGTAVHEGIEKRDANAAVESYKANFQELTSQHEFEIEKLKLMTEIAIQQIPECETYEYKLDVADEYTGFIDGLVKNDDGTYDILDFKCSNAVSSYKNSPQVHIYQYYFEHLTGNKVRDLYYVFIPKATTKLNESMDNKQLILDELSKMNVRMERVEFNQSQVNYFFARKRLMENAKFFPKKPNRFCPWCQFRKLCETNGVDRSELKGAPNDINL